MCDRIGRPVCLYESNTFSGTGETVACSSLFFELGGKGFNQAVACARMGVRTVFIGAVGEDENGEVCRSLLEKEGINTCLIKKTEPTAFAVITTVPGGENTVEVFSGAASKLQGADLENNEIKGVLKECDYLLVQNELSSECLKEILKLAKEADVPVILNPAPAENIPSEILAACEIITPNCGEAKLLAGIYGQENLSDRKLWEARYYNGEQGSSFD